MSQQIQVVRVGARAQTSADVATIASNGVYSPEEQPDGAYQPWEVLINEYGEWKVSTLTPAYTNQSAVVLGSAAIDATNDIITYANHRFFEGEQIKFSNVTGTGLSNTTQYYAKSVTQNTFKVSDNRSLSSTVDLLVTANPTAITSFSVVRFAWYHQDCASGKTAIYTPIGCPVSTSDHTQPALESLRDFTFSIPPLAMCGGGNLYVKIEGSIYNDDSDHDLFLVLDPDSNVYGDGFQGADSGYIATVTSATSQTNCDCTGHPFLDGQLVYVIQTSSGGTGLPTGLSASTPYYVNKIGADDFELCTDVAMTSPVVMSSNGEFFVRRAPYGSKYAVRFAFTIPALKWFAPIVLGSSVIDAVGEKITYTAHGLSSGEAVKFKSVAGTGLTAGTTYYIKNPTTDDFQVSALSDLSTTVNLSASTDANFGIVRKVGRRVPVVFEAWASQVGGQCVETTATENTNWRGRLTIPEYALVVDPATSGGAYVFTQSHMRTRPSIAGTMETVRYSWGPISRLWYFDSYPSFTMSSGATLTGATSGATGVLVDHDVKRKTLTYRKLNPDLDFQSGETVSDGTNSLTIANCERGPLPSKLGVRAAWEGPDNDPLYAEFIASNIQISISRKRIF